MKTTKRLALASTLLGLTATASGTAHAQSSVTLYGITDAGISYLKTSTGNRFSLLSGGLSGDRWGLKGSEDLGGGLKAIFQLESGFSIGTGKLAQGGREFGRQSFAGLTSERLGSVVAGRMYDPIVDLVQPLTADGAGGSVPFATPGDVDNNDFSARVSNAVKYLSPTFGRVRFEALVAPGGVAGSLGQGYTLSAAALYAGGPLKIAAGYFQAANADGTTAIRTGWNSASSDSFFQGGSINAAYQSAHVIGVAQVAAQYEVGALQLGAGYSNARYTADGHSAFANTERFDTGRVYGFYRVTPALRLGAGYVFTSASGDASAHYNEVSAGTFYRLSKLTDVYLTAAFERASGTQRTTSGGLQAARATISSYGIDGSGTQTIVTAGLRHRF
ncbi:porin [Burkholderia multivorans]|uniref:porin n=1 Tax=Burkholderia multivorans TaxID=87883 RepID=UPI000CFF1454|nr:porin [Burkholderia multivorans]MBU9366042.1 porin [Burkholderia multivorans]PRG77666.1 porin [Burkholderia multivorans]